MTLVLPLLLGICYLFSNCFNPLVVSLFVFCSFLEPFCIVLFTRIHSVLLIVVVLFWLSMCFCRPMLALFENYCFELFIRLLGLMASYFPA